MTKALREMEAIASKVDSVVYVLDARIPLSSVNPAYDSIFKNKPRLYVLNKADMVPQEELAKWKNFFAKNGNSCIVTNSTVKGGNKIFISELKKILSPILQKYEQKGVRKTLRAMVIGVPNCGKSTLINSLVPKKRTMTGNKPGVTRGQQWVSVDPYIDLLDTPGTLFPDFSDQKKATNLAICGSIKDTIVDNIELSLEIIDFVKRNRKEALLDKYSLNSIDENNLVNLENIAKSKHYVLKGNEIDLERTATSVIQDFRKGALGKFILDTYENRN